MCRLTYCKEWYKQRRYWRDGLIKKRLCQNSESCCSTNVRSCRETKKYITSTGTVIPERNVSENKRINRKYSSERDVSWEARTRLFTNASRIDTVLRRNVPNTGSTEQYGLPLSDGKQCSKICCFDCCCKSEHRYISWAEFYSHLFYFKAL